MTEHTPAPWKTIKLDGEWYFNPARESGEYALIGKVQKGHSLAKMNAAHIVKCVNAHDELEDAVRYALGILQEIEMPGNPELKEELYTALDKCEHALNHLAKVKGV